MQIASWNVNSIKARMHAVTKWLKAAQPDVVCLQETKTIDGNFPYMEIESLGYNVAVHGQKSYNGVAVLSKTPFEEVNPRLPGDDSDEQARYLEVVIGGKTGPVRVASIYLPNGNPAPAEIGGMTDKYALKLNWMRRLKTHTESLLKHEEPLILAGDYNVIPEAQDCHDPKAWFGDALYRPETHAAWRALLNLGLTESFAQVDGRAGQYTFWDFQRGGWENNHGIRIDHLLLSPQAADHLTGFRIDKMERDGVKPSDHVPVVGTFDL